ncbi:hypothetical protein TRFO_28763 [Tritrichomonas foetus]|uniref:DnaK protein n=1 Tax=Tritrichomonas foetus TaxID=1144522 RepID=A0A1J4K2E1_9EUKA|nr:hypothetical protein TRFO_28763 [Tritrichomonas foetus]|eukprot:OHT03916.1 hypothetical protein TRFO_28763 [Tritrichomonas foetus]
MFAIFISLCVVDYLGIDLGSQYYKLALSTSNGQVNVFTNPVSNSVIHPSAIALKFIKPHDPPFKPDDFSDIEVRTSRHALQIIKRNNSLGYEYLPLLIRKNRTDFNTSSIARPEELTPLLLYRAFMSVPQFKQVAISLAPYTTRSQYKSIADAAQMIGANIAALVDDITSVSLLYSSIRVSRFIRQPKHVLFVDVGASATVAFSATFEYSKEPTEHALINQTSYDFTEKVSGIAFANTLANKTNISHRKAMKAMIRTSGEGKEDYFIDEMHYLTEFLRDLVDVASKVRPIDEVQIIGGASTYKFVANTIKAATNHTIRRDFNANEAVAMGATAAAMIMAEESAFLPAFFMKKPSMSVNVTFGEQTKVYCTRGVNCTNFLEFDYDEEKCDFISLVADEKDIAKGSNPVLTKLKINQTIPNNCTVRFYLQEPDSIIQEAQYCDKTEGTCLPLELVSYDDETDTGLAYIFMKNFMLSAQKRGTLDEIEKLLNKLSNYITKLDNSRVEATYPATDEMKETVQKYQTMKEEGKLATMSVVETNEAYQVLKTVASDLHLKIE